MARILLVDDDDTFLLLMGKQLTALGHRVVSSRSAREALAVAERSPGSIDLLITDLVMPDLSGRDLIRVLRQGDYSDLPVIIVSACSRQEAYNLADVLADPRIRFMAKPVDFFAISSAIGKLLQMRATAFVALSPEEEEMLRRARPPGDD